MKKRSTNVLFCGVRKKFFFSLLDVRGVLFVFLRGKRRAVTTKKNLFRRNRSKQNARLLEGLFFLKQNAYEGLLFSYFFERWKKTKDCICVQC